MPSEKASYTLGKSDDRAFKLNPIITHRSRNGGGRGGARPPQCWCCQSIFICENGFFDPHSSYFCKAQAQILTSNISIMLYTHKKTVYMTFYMSPNKFGPPISNIFLLHYYVRALSHMTGFMSTCLHQSPPGPHPKILDQPL